MRDSDIVGDMLWWGEGNRRHERKMEVRPDDGERPREERWREGHAKIWGD